MHKLRATIRSEKGGKSGARDLPTAGGFSLIEVMLVVAVALVLAAISAPLIQGTLKAYHLKAAVAGVSGAIQGTRYNTIMYGCPYTIAFNQSTTSYQVADEPLTGSPPACATTFSSVNGAIPWSSTGDVSMSPSTTLQFSPNGTVVATAGSLTFTLTNGTLTETITVSGVGNVTVSP